MRHFLNQAYSDVHSLELAEASTVALLHGRIRPTGEPQRRSERRTILDRVVALMEDNLIDPIGMEALVGKSGISKRRMFRRFKKEFGCPPSQYYLNLRLDRARDLIAATDLPMSVVANATGFSSPNWFSNAYKRRFGLAPLKHRSRLASRSGHRGGIQSNPEAC